MSPMPYLRACTKSRWLSGTACCVCAVGALMLGMVKNARSASTVAVDMTVASETYLAIDPVGAPPNGCQTGTSNVTSFGSVVPGLSSITTSDCNVVWGSNNDSAILRLYQADGFGHALHATPDSGTRAFYRLDDSPVDSSVTNNPLTLPANPNDPSYTAGPRGTNGLDLDANDYATAPYNAALDLDTFTVDAWVRVDAYTAGSKNRVVIKSTSGTARNFSINIDTSGRADSDISAGGVDLGSLTDADGPNLIGTGWHHLAQVVDSAPVNPNKIHRLYVDGGLAESITFSGNVDNPATPLRIGSRDNAAEFLDGAVDDVRVTNRALTAAEIADYFNNTSDAPDYDDDNVGADYNWSEGASMFGACLESATNGAAGGTGIGAWPVAGNNNCTTGFAGWRPVVPTSGTPGSKVAGLAPGPVTNAAVTLRFGFKVAAAQAIGTYEAPLIVEVVVP